MFFALRAFSSGCTALTGVEAIANGVPAFKPPKAKNAQLTLVLMGAIAVSMFVGITALALISKVHITDPTTSSCHLGGRVRAARARRSAPSSPRWRAAVFGGPHSIGFFYIQATTALILVLAANTAFNGFPLLGRDPRAGQEPARAAEHPRRSARVQQRHPDAGGRRRLR